MTDAGFFRGTSADQDNRFADKQKKLLKELNFSPILNTKLNMSKIDVESLKPWIEQKIKDILVKDDEILSESIFEHLTGKEPDGKNLLLLLTGFVEEDSKASKFMEELWTKLIDIQQNINGVSPKATATTSPSDTSPGNVQQTKEKTQTDPPAPGTNDGAEDAKDTPSRDLIKDDARKSRSRSCTPQSHRVVSKTHSRSNSRSPHHSGSAPRSGSKSVSRPRSRSRSGSRSPSRSRSGSRKQSASRSRSRSRSSSRSRHSRSRSRSPHYRSSRFRRSRSRSGSYRSPRARRGYIPRGSYRGSFGYQDRRRGGPIGPPRGRRVMSPPWSRRGRSPPPHYRRRRSPSRSPRRRSRSPAYRNRRSRSRSPPFGHMMGRRSPRPHGYAGGPPMGPMGGRHIPPHDIHRSVMPPRSPRGPPIDYARGYGDSSSLPGHSPGHIIGRSHDLLPTSHGLSSGPPRPSGSGAYSPRSPSSDRKRHKKDKKHRKHKKSKKRHSSSSSPERRKKHKKHKKSKKHKS